MSACMPSYRRQIAPPCGLRSLPHVDHRASIAPQRCVWTSVTQQWSLLAYLQSRLTSFKHAVQRLNCILSVSFVELDAELPMS